MVSEDYKYLFKPFEVGDMTDKGKIDDLFFLRFGSGSNAFIEDEPKGKGLLMARINKKDYAIGELKKI